MRVRWLASALASLEQVHAYIAADNPHAATRVAAHIRRTTDQLRRFPHAGRPGQVPGTRELVVTGMPYVVVYRVAEPHVDILRVFHTAIDRSAGSGTRSTEE